jgi:hypothetical protein
VAVGVFVGVFVGVDVEVAVGVAVLVGVLVGVLVTVAVGVGVAVGEMMVVGSLALSLVVSTSFPPLTVTVLVTLAGALGSTLTVSEIGG